MYTDAIRVGDVINQWRKELGLDEVAMFEGPRLAEILKIPFTYCWSPALIPRPSDWPSHIGESSLYPPYIMQSMLTAFPLPLQRRLWFLFPGSPEI